MDIINWNDVVVYAPNEFYRYSEKFFLQEVEDYKKTELIGIYCKKKKIIYLLNGSHRVYTCYKYNKPITIKLYKTFEECLSKINIHDRKYYINKWEKINPNPKKWFGLFKNQRTQNLFNMYPVAFFYDLSIIDYIDCKQSKKKDKIMYKVKDVCNK